MKEGILTLALLSTLSFNVPSIEGDGDKTVVDKNSELKKTDATAVKKALLENVNFKLPLAATALIALESDLAVESNHSIHALKTKAADNADIADLSLLSQTSLNANMINGLDSSYILDNQNLSGTLSLERLMGSLLYSDGKVKKSVLSGIYDINISGSSNSATIADDATLANEMLKCSGGADLCDLFEIDEQVIIPDPVDPDPVDPDPVVDTRYTYVITDNYNVANSYNIPQSNRYIVVNGVPDKTPGCPFRINEAKRGEVCTDHNTSCFWGVRSQNGTAGGGGAFYMCVKKR